MRGVFAGTGVRATIRGFGRRRWAVAIVLCGLLAPLGFAADDLDPLLAPTNASQPDALPSDDLELPRLGESRAPARFPQEGERLADVVVEGNKTIVSALILQKVKTQPGRPADVKQIQADVRALWGTKWFSNVETIYRRTDKGLVLIFHVDERPVVKRVEYIGSKQIKLKNLADQTGLKVGSPYDVSANREAARRLEDYYHEKGFPFATVELEKGNERDEREVVFRIFEGAKTKVVWRNFEGNRAFGDDLLALHLKTKSAILFYFGGKYDPANIPEDIAAIRQYYESLGYFDAKVGHRVEFSENKKRAYITYTVQEGQRSKIRDVAVTGNSRFTTDELRKQLKIRPGEYFNTRTVNKDLLAIKTKYGQLGYTFAAVDVVPRFLEEPGEVDLVVRIDEGIPYTVRNINIHIEGDHPRTKLTVANNYTGIAPGDLADPAKIDKSKRKLGGAQVFKTDPSGGGPRVVIRRVAENDGKQKAPSIRGQNGPGDSERNTSGRQSPIQGTTRNVSRPASPPTPSASDPIADDSRSSIAVDPVFEEDEEGHWAAEVIRGQSVDDPFAVPANPLFENSPQGDPYAGVRRTPQGEIDLDYYLSEERTGRLMFGVGVNSNAGLVGSIVYQEQNFDILRPPRSFADIVNGTAWRGGGQRFRLEAIPGTQVSRYTASWSDPYFLDTNYSLGLSGFYYSRFFRDWTEQRTGGRVTFGRQFTQQISATGALRLEDVKVFNPRTPTPPILEDVVGDNFLSTARASIIHDTRDSSFLPGEGHQVELSFEQGFGEFVYPRAEAEARQYFTLYSRPDGGGRQILTLGGQIGWTDTDTPIFERFYAGGFQNFRGFQFRGVSPRELNVQIGGRWMALGTVEYMVPLLASEVIQGVAFTDFGTVENSVGLNDFRVSVGVGLRVAVPAMGPVPLAFDFAIPIMKQHDDITQIFSFYVGATR